MYDITVFFFFIYFRIETTINLMNIFNVYINYSIIELFYKNDSVTNKHIFVNLCYYFITFITSKRKYCLM